MFAWSTNALSAIHCDQLAFGIFFLQLSEISDIPLENLEFAKVCEMHHLAHGS